MRQFFEEGDLLVAEVQSFFVDGTMSLHTRSLTYGKVCRKACTSALKTHPATQLRNGQLVCVPPILIRRLKSHFVSLPCNVDLILGLNGYIWVSKHINKDRQQGEEGLDAESVYSNQNEVSLYPGEGSWTLRAQHQTFQGDRRTNSNGHLPRHQSHQSAR
jgi:exosome complex component RRP4